VELAADGRLLDGYDQLHAARAQQAGQRVQRAQADRAARAAQWRSAAAEPDPSSGGTTLAWPHNAARGGERARDQQAEAARWRELWPAAAGSSPSPPLSEEEERLLFAVRNPRRLDRKAVAGFAGMLAHQRRLEDALGAALLVEPVKAQVAVMAELVSEARGPLRPVVTDLAAQYAQFCGWLSVSADGAAGSNVYFDRALEWATEAENTDMAANAMSFKAHTAWVTGRPGAVIGLSEAARRDRRVCIAQRAYDAGQQARGYAMTGDSPATERLLGEAADLAERAAGHTGDMPPWVYYYSPTFFTLQRGLAYRHLSAHHPRHNKVAVSLLTAGLAGLPEDLHGAEWSADFIHQLALAHAQAGEPEQACAQAATVAAIASQTSSERLLMDTRRLYARLASRWREHTAVAELGNTLGVRAAIT